MFLDRSEAIDPFVVRECLVIRGNQAGDAFGTKVL